jgi:hypothetical protein
LEQQSHIKIMKYLHDTALAEITALLSDCPVWSSTTADGKNAANSRTLHGRLEAYTTKRAGTDKKYAGNLSGRYTAEQEAAAEEKLAVLLLQQQDFAAAAVSAAASTSVRAMRGRKRRSASTGEAPSEIQKSRTALLVQPPVGRRCRANSLDIPRWNTDPGHSSEVNCTAVPSQPNFRALSLASVNRRLLTDLILTLNHSFPDYDFAAAGVADFTVCSLQTAVTRINERLGEFSAATAASSVMSGATSGFLGNPNNNGSSFLSTLWKAVDDVIVLSQVSEVYSYQPNNAESSDDPFSFLKNSLVKGCVDDYEYAVASGSEMNGYDRNVSSVVDTYGGVDDDDSEYGDDFDESYKSRRRTGSIAVHREVLWTFNYFFVNKQAKRILLFTCIETMTRSGCFYEAPIAPLVSSSHRNNTTSSLTCNAIPEDKAVHHQLCDRVEVSNDIADETDRTPESGLNLRRRQYKYLRHSPSIHSSDDESNDVSGTEEADDDDDDDSHTIASSSVVSVDFDLDPANAVSGGIPIGN